MKNLLFLILVLSLKAFAQVQPSPELDLYMRQMYAQQLAQQQQQQQLQLQMATISPEDRLRLIQSIKMGQQQYALQFVPQSGPYMGQTMWSSYNTRNPLFNFFSSLGSMTKSPERAERMQAREPISVYRSPEPRDRPEQVQEQIQKPSREALRTMTVATEKLNNIKNPNKPAECLDCITDPPPKFTAPAISGKGTIKTSASGQIKEDLNAEIKCSSGGEFDSFAATVEAKIEHNKVVSFKYTATEGKKTCVVDLASYPQRQAGNTTNIILQHPNQKTFVAIYANNKSPDRKNPSVQFNVMNFQEVCPQMNRKYFMQIEADPKTGRCR